MEQLAVALPMIQGLAEEVNALKNQQPRVGVGAQLAARGGTQVDGVAALSNPNEAIEETNAAKQRLTA